MQAPLSPCPGTFKIDATTIVKQHSKTKFLADSAQAGITTKIVATQIAKNDSKTKIFRQLRFEILSRALFSPGRNPRPLLWATISTGLTRFKSLQNCFFLLKTNCSSISKCLRKLLNGEGCAFSLLQWILRLVNVFHC